MSETRVLKASDYVHLHNHTQYSLLDGLTKVPALVEHIKNLGMSAVAVTDHGNMSGVIEFYKAALGVGIKPLIGMEAYVAARRLHNKDPAKDRPNYHLTLLAMNNQGYQNLMQLSTIAHLEGFYYRPRVDRVLLEKYQEGLIVLSGCLGSEMGEYLQQEQYDKAKNVAQWYKKTFADRYYIEIADHGHPDHPTTWALQQKVNRDLLKIAEELGIEAVVTSDAHYLKHEDQEAHEILLCVQTSSFLSDKKRFSLSHLELHVADPQDVIKRWGKEHPSLITNTSRIAERCSVELDLGNILIPQFPVPKGETEKSYLHKKVWQGLVWRYSDKTEQQSDLLSIEEAKKNLPDHIVTRAEFELSTVDKMGFNGYLLIVADFINWGKERGIVFGPGRGSAAGSIVCYATRITELDPLSYDLLFERFLNPDRIAMPDIDIDIQDTRRDEVIQYCIEKYGRDQVANIVTFGRMAARNAVRDVARVLEMPYVDADRLAKLIPPPVQGRHIPLTKSLAANQDLKRAYESSPQAKRVLDLAQHLEMTIRSHGVHAAGVVIAPDKIVSYAPLEMAQKGVITTQYDMHAVQDDIGLLKMDFLGLSNLTIIKNTLRIIKKVYEQDIDITQIPMDDPETFSLLQRGETTGVFQLESAGMKRYLKELKPTVFDDIIAMVALYRPGPMQWIEDFIARKHGLRAIEYAHPAMESSLNNTYGVIVYQEQVMQISIEMCGFSGGQADTLRKAIGKKDPAVMAKLKSAFIEGAIKLVGAKRADMEKFWKQLEDFAAYCFNKSHAACYALIAYQTAYLKAHFPSAFMAALMTSDYDDTDRLAVEISECKHMGITVLPPDINESFHEFGVVPEGDSRRPAIRFGLDAIKNVGRQAVEEIIQARQSIDGFKSLEDYCRHVAGRSVNRKSLESLIKAGAFDRFGERGLLLANIDTIMALSNRLHKEKASGQVGLFETGADEASTTTRMQFQIPPGPSNTRLYLNWERELLGLYISEHPLEAFEAYLSEQAMPISTLNAEQEGQAVMLGGSIVTSREVTTKNGQKMAFVSLADLTGEIELTVFPKLYQETSPLWQRDQVVSVRGTLSNQNRAGRDETIKVLVDAAEEIDPQTAIAYKALGQSQITLPITKKPKTKHSSRASRLYIRFSESKNQEPLHKLKQLLNDYKGDTEVVLVTGPPSQKQVIKLPQTILLSKESEKALRGVFGHANVVVK